MQEFREEKPRKKSSGCWGFFTLFFIIALLAGAAFGWWKYYYNYSEGYRTGLLQKLSHKGNVFKTYEGELILSSVVSSGNVTMASEKFFFSVENDSIARAMMNAQGERMKLHYIEKKGALPWRGDTQYIVDSFVVEPDYYQTTFGYPGNSNQYNQPQPQQQPQQQNYPQPPVNYQTQPQTDQNGYPVPPNNSQAYPQQPTQGQPNNYPQQAPQYPAQQGQPQQQYPQQPPQQTQQPQQNLK